MDKISDYFIIKGQVIKELFTKRCHNTEQKGLFY